MRSRATEVVNPMIKSYSELITLPTFEERFDYLKLGGSVGQSTFGFDRYLNQQFYTSGVWRKFRDEIIARDLGCDLGVEGYEINGQPILIHHINPLKRNDIIDRSPYLMDPDNVITTTYRTHQAIHYGDKSQIFTGLVERFANDTCPWRQ